MKINTINKSNNKFQTTTIYLDTTNPSEINPLFAEREAIAVKLFPPTLPTLYGVAPENFPTDRPNRNGAVAICATECVTMEFADAYEERATPF